MKYMLLFLTMPLLLNAGLNKPSNLVLTPTETSVALKWQDKSADERGFKILRNGKLIDFVKQNVKSYVDRGLSPHTRYKYEVKASDDFGFKLTGNFYPKASHVGLFIDTDNNPNTGYHKQGINGAEIMVSNGHLYTRKNPDANKWSDWEDVGSSWNQKTGNTMFITFDESQLHGVHVGSHSKIQAFSDNEDYSNKRALHISPTLFSQNNDVVKHTLFVDAHHGSNDGDGSANNPYKTIQSAVDAARVNEKVFIKAGLYHERVDVTKSSLIIEGERDARGKPMVTVHGGEKVTVHWTQSAISPLTFETTDIPYKTYAMTLFEDGVFKDIPRLALRGRGDEPNDMYHLNKDLKKDQTSYDFKYILAISKGFMVKDPYTNATTNYWDGIEALYAYDDRTGTTYVRFRDGDDPNDKELYSSKGELIASGSNNQQGTVFRIHNQHHVTIRGLSIDGAQNGVLIYGAGAHHNIIENNDIKNGQSRVHITEDAYANDIRDNKMHMVLLSDTYRPGAWMYTDSDENHQTRDSLTAEEKKYFAVAANYYNRYKREIGHSTASSWDDNGVLVTGAGENNRIYQNEIFDTLGGVVGDAKGRLEIYDNIFHHISSMSVLRKNATAPLYIYNNRFYNVAFALRAQLYTSDSILAKRIWFFNNIVYNPLKAGTHFMFARNDVNTTPSDANLPKIYLYHNTFIGADREYYSLAKVGKYIQAVNNIFYLARPRVDKDMHFGVVSYNWFSGIDTFSNHDHTNIDNQGESLWQFSNLRNPSSLTMPRDFTLPAGSSAINAGIDLSKNYTINGVTYPALPFMKTGYFRENRPNIGAVQ